MAPAWVQYRLGRWRAGVLLGVVLCCLAAALGAEGTEGPRPDGLTVGWVEEPGLATADGAGPPLGFLPDLAGAIAGQLDVPVSYRRYGSLGALLSAHETGQVDLLIGTNAQPGLAERGFQMIPISTTDIQVFVSAVRADALRATDFADMRLALVSPGLAAPEVELLGPGDVVRYTQLSQAIGALLLGQIDGLVSPADMLWPRLADARLDTRVTTIAPPAASIERVISLHPSKSALAGPIHAAVAALEADGTIEQLRDQWLISAPPPVPDVLAVGVPHAPPYAIIGPDGEASGFAVEMFRDLAELADLRYRLVPLDAARLAEGPVAGGYDMIALATIDPRPGLPLAFTDPLDLTEFSFFARSDTPLSGGDMAALEGQMIGALAGPPGIPPLPLPGADLAEYPEAATLLSALMTNRIDLAYYPTLEWPAAAQSQHVTPLVRQLELPPVRVPRGIALRPGLGPVRERLNHVLPGYLESDRYRDLRALWLDQPGPWTDRWMTGLLMVLGGLSLLLIGSQVWQFRHHRAAEKERRIVADLIDRIPLGMILLDRSGRVVYANEEANLTHNIGASPLRTGRLYRDVVAESISNGLIRTNGEAAADVQTRLTEVSMAEGYRCEVHGAGGRVWTRVTRALPDGQFLLLRRDVTEDRRRLNLIRDLNRDLAEQVRLAQTTNNELRAFAYATSHDLKAPTNTALMLLEELREDLTTSGQVDESLDDLDRTLSLMRRLIEDVLSYTNTIGEELRTETVDLTSVARDCANGLRDRIREAGASVVICDLPSISASATQMHQLIQNLMGNALKFRTPDRLPEISIRPHGAPDGMVGFAVTDNGIGIAPEHHQRIFKLFERLNHGERFAGTGLGLGICHRIALNHGGTIQVQSEPGQGSTFIVTLKHKAAP